MASLRPRTPGALGCVTGDGGGEVFVFVYLVLFFFLCWVFEKDSITVAINSHLEK